jgi:hypothetical protein
LKARSRLVGRDRLRRVAAGERADVVRRLGRHREAVRHAAAAAGDELADQPREGREAAGGGVGLLQGEADVEPGRARHEQLLFAAEQEQVPHRHRQLQVLDAGDVEAKRRQVGW